jgi:hypothetical protein
LRVFALAGRVFCHPFGCAAWKINITTNNSTCAELGVPITFRRFQFSSSSMIRCSFWQRSAAGSGIKKTLLLGIMSGHTRTPQLRESHSWQKATSFILQKCDYVRCHHHAVAVTVRLSNLQPR